jgi:hypothetical protein
MIANDRVTVEITNSMGAITKQYNGTFEKYAEGYAVVISDDDGIERYESHQHVRKFTGIEKPVTELAEMPVDYTSSLEGFEN